jgi:hypothetical protein
MDSSIKCDPAGVEKGHFQIGEIAQMAGSALGQAEKLYQTLSGDKQAANGTGTDEKGDPIPRETFLIGSGIASYIPRESGYLYCFGNDARQTYDNNRGSVRLTIRKK